MSKKRILVSHFFNLSPLTALCFAPRCLQLKPEGQLFFTRAKRVTSPEASAASVLEPDT